MPAKVKEMAETTQKTALQQVSEKHPERAEKAAGPLSVNRAISTPQPPPNGNPAVANAAEVLGADRMVEALRAALG